MEFAGRGIYELNHIAAVAADGRLFVQVHENWIHSLWTYDASEPAQIVASNANGFFSLGPMAIVEDDLFFEARRPDSDGTKVIRRSFAIGILKNRSVKQASSSATYGMTPYGDGLAFAARERDKPVSLWLYDAVDNQNEALATFSDDPKATITALTHQEKRCISSEILMATSSASGHIRLSRASVRSVCQSIILAG